RSAETAEDLVQDILLYVWENRARWHPPTTVHAYLYRAVRNRALNVLRDRKPQAALDMAESVPDETEPGSDLQYRELLVQYREAVQALPERRRQVFTLSRLYGLTYEEVAETLGISINTVRTQMTAALKHLRERLSD